MSWAMRALARFRSGLTIVPRGTLSGLRAAHGDLEEAIRERDQALQRRAGAIDALSATVRDHEGAIGLLERALRDREGAVEALEDTVRSREGAIEKLGAAVIEREDLLRDLEEQIAHLAGQVREREAATAHREHLLRMREAEIAVLESIRTARDATSESEPGGIERAAAAIVDRGTTRNWSPTAVSRRVGEADDAILREWTHVAVSRGWSELRGGQAPINPYIVERFMDGVAHKLLVATEEGRAWYDKVDLTEVPHCQTLGLLKRGDTVFDCGANHGVNALYYSRIVGPGGRVLAFDPFPLNIEIVRFNARLNARTNIETVPVGLSNRSGETAVSIAEQCVEILDRAASDTITINLQRLDSFAHLRPDFLKIDIEGAEVDALEGAQEVMSQRPSAYIEMHPTYLPRFGRSMMDIFRYIDLAAYAVYLNVGTDAPLPYEGQFDLKDHCGIFLVPRSRPALVRYYASASVPSEASEAEVRAAAT